MGCGALSFEKARTADDEKRDAAASKIQTTFCTRADHELKIVLDSATSIVQRLGKAVREHDEAAIRYELVQIQKLSPPTIALVRAHAGGRTIKLPIAAGHALAEDILASLEVGSGAPLGVIAATERVLKVFSWDGHRPDKSGDLVADDAGSWELLLDDGGKVDFNGVWRQLRVQSSIGQLLEVLPEKRWRIDAATVALQELKLACPHTNCARFEVANILSDILFPQIEVEFGEGAQWERNSLERMQVLLAAMFHVGGNVALLKLLDEAFGLISDRLTSGVPSCHYFLLWDGLLRCAQHLRPSLSPAIKEDTGSYVRVVGNRDYPELNGYFGRVLDVENGIALGKARDDEEFVSIQIGSAKARVPSGTVAQASTQLDKALSKYMKPDYLDFLQAWLDELCSVAASAAKQPDIAPAKSSQFTSTADRVVCSVCSTFVFFVDKESSRNCVTCGSCVTAGFEKPSTQDCSSVRREMREFELGMPAKLTISIWRCPKCNEEFPSWEDEGDEDGLLSHLRETGHATAKNGKKKFRVVQGDVSLVEESGSAGSALEEEMQILRIYRLLHISHLAGSVNAAYRKFAETLKRRHSQLSFESGNRLLKCASFAGVPLCAVNLVYPPLVPVQSAFAQCLKDKDWEPVSRLFAKLSPVLQALAVGLPELDSLLRSYRETLPSVPNNFQTLKEALLLVYNIPVSLRSSVLEASEYQEALSRCRKAGELPDSWDLSGLLENSNNKQRESTSKISIMDIGAVEDIEPSPTNNLSRKTLDASLVAHFQGFVDATWVKKWSRDRKGDPWGEDVPSCFTVKEVVQVMNMQNWQDYLEVRRTLGKPDQVLKDCDAALTDQPGGRLTASYSVVGEHLKHHLNEVWLWHGTKPMAADSIAANDFEISKAGSHRGTLYGNGIYLAESSTKADEYCRETNSLGWRSMLLCRCVMGKYYYCNKETTGEECEKAVMKDKYHCVLGDRRKLRNSFREFVFYDHRQVYPCFLVFYERGDPIPHESKKKTDS